MTINLEPIHMLAIAAGFSTAVLVTAGAGIVYSLSNEQPQPQCFHSITMRSTFQQAATAREFNCIP